MINVSMASAVDNSPINDILRKHSDFKCRAFKIVPSKREAGGKARKN